MDKERIIADAMSFKFGGMSENELSYLYDLCIDKKVLELGSMIGMSSYVIASVANSLSCIDVWSDTQEHLSHDPAQQEVYRDHLPMIPNMLKQFKLNCADFIESGIIEMHQGNTRKLSNLFEDYSFDLILLDADHSYEGVSIDFDLYKNKIKPDGIIAFHDYGDCMWLGIAAFCDSLIKTGKIKMIKQVGRLATFNKIG